MSEAKFTKGNWELSVGENLSLSMNGSTEMCNERYYPWCPSNKYDWHLIAAAPDMYEYLEGLYQNLCSIGDDSETVDEIKTLLKKARGGK